MRDKWKIGIIIVLAIIFLVGGGLMLGAVELQSAKTLGEKDKEGWKIPETSGTTYYVDAAAEEGNDGLTPETALKTLVEVNELELKPGDQVLFKRDCKWNGALVVSASGTEDAPIAFDAYGDGENAPVLNAHGQSPATISGTDVSYIEVRNLEILNEGDRSTYLRGIFFNALNEDVAGIKILNNYVHDVNSCNYAASLRDFYNVGSAYQDYHWQGGIVIRAGGYAVPEGKVIVKDILVEGNHVEEVAVDGIVVGSITKSWNKSTGVVIRDNYVKRAAGDGILLFSSEGGIIEGNTCDKNGWAATEPGFKHNFVGIFIIYCDKTLIQYNEVSNQYPCEDDGQAFDADDTCTDTLIQYNYSHDNANGFLLLFNMDNNGHAVVRYNISQNDGGPFLTFSCKDSNYPMVATAELYNNTCYTTKPITEMIEIAPNVDMRNAESKRLVLEIENNIFYNKGTDNLPALNNDTYEAYMTFSNNCWYGFSERKLPQHEKNQMIEDPMLCYAGSATTGLDSAFGYKLLKDSPCLGAGKDIYNNGGLDYYGTTLADNVNIGAYFGEGTKKPEGVNLALGQPTAISEVDAIAMLRDVTLTKVTDGDAGEVAGILPVEDKNAEGWFEVDLEDDYKVKKVILKAGEDASLFPKHFDIEVWDGKEWKKASSEKVDKIPDSNETVEFKFGAVKGNKVRIRMTEMRENSKGKFTAQISEFEVYE